MRVRILQLVEDSNDFQSAEEVKEKVADLKANPDRYKIVNVNKTDSGAVVSLHTVEVLRPDDEVELPASQAESLVSKGFAELA